MVRDRMLALIEEIKEQYLSFRTTNIDIVTNAMIRPRCEARQDSILAAFRGPPLKASQQIATLIKDEPKSTPSDENSKHDENDFMGHEYREEGEGDDANSQDAKKGKDQKVNK